MRNWQSGDVEVNGLRLHYTRTGGAGPALVLAHGFSDDGLCWTPLAEALEPDYDVIMVDARGHGKSDAPEEGYGVAELASDLRGVIAALGLHRPAVLGHSMGGGTAFMLAGTYPDVAGAILIEDAGAPIRPPAPAAPGEDRWAGMRKWVTGLKRQTRDELIAGERTRNPTWSDAEFGTWADSKHRLSVNVLNRSEANPVDWASVLPRITCPALLITADPARGAMVTEEGATELQARIPQLRVVHIPDAGHSVRRDQPDRYMAVVREFLAETTARAGQTPTP